MNKYFLNFGFITFLCCFAVFFCLFPMLNQGIYAVEGQDDNTSETEYKISYMQRLSSGELVEIPQERLNGNPTSYTPSQLPITTLKGAIADEGYQFDGWYIESNVGLLPYNSETDTYTLPAGYTGDLVINGDFSLIQYSITYEGLPIGATNSGPQTYTINDTIDLTQVVPYIYGSEFLGWYSDSALNNPITTIPQGSTGNITIYASFKEKTVTISFSELFDSMTVSYGSNPYGESGVLSQLNPKKEGYTFAGWYTTPDLLYYTMITDNYTFTSDVTLYPKWNKQADDSVIWVAVGFAGLAVISFGLWFAFARPKIND